MQSVFWFYSSCLRNIKKRSIRKLTDRIIWRRHPDLNRGIKVLQTFALPLGYSAAFRSKLFYFSINAMPCQLFEHFFIEKSAIIFFRVFFRAVNLSANTQKKSVMRKIFCMQLFCSLSGLTLFVFFDIID